MHATAKVSALAASSHCAVARRSRARRASHSPDADHLAREVVCSAGKPDRHADEPAVWQVVAGKHAHQEVTSKLPASYQQATRKLPGSYQGVTRKACIRRGMRVKEGGAACGYGLRVWVAGRTCANLMVPSW